ncbi:TPA: hypothetical protein ACN35C_002502 [Vibrio parahaemolyticus]
MGEVKIERQTTVIKREINKSLNNTLTITTLQAKHLWDVFSGYRGLYKPADFLDHLDYEFELYEELQTKIEKIVGLPYDRVNQHDPEDKLWEINALNLQDIIPIIVYNTL